MARLGTTRFRYGGINQSLAYALDGKVLVSGGFPFGVCILDAETGVALRQVNAHHYCRSRAVSGDGKTLLTDSLTSFDIATGKELGRLQQKTARYLALSFDGQTAAVAESGSKDVELWDLKTAKQLRVLKGHTENVRQPVFSPDGKLVAAGGNDQTICLWDAATGQQIRQFDVKLACDPVFAPNGKILATNGVPFMGGEAVRLWDAETGKELRALKGSEESGSDLAFSPDGKILATAGRVGMIQLWDPATGKLIRQWTNDPITLAIAFSPDGKVLASAEQSAIRRWDAATGKELGITAGHRGRVDWLRFSADGKTLSSSSRNKALCQWDLQTFRDQLVEIGGATAVGKGEWIDRLWEVSPDSKILAKTRFIQASGPNRDAKFEEAIHLFDARTGKSIRTLNGTKFAPFALKFTPDGKTLWSAGADGTRAWDVATGARLHFFPQITTKQFDGYAFSSDCEFAAVPLAGATIGLFDLTTGKEIRRWEAQAESVNRLHFSPDGKWLASWLDHDIRVWRVDSGKEVARLGPSGDDHLTTALAFSPDGQILAVADWFFGEDLNDVASMKFSIHLWEVRSQQEIRKIGLENGSAPALAYSHDGRILAAGNEDSTILLWDLSSQARGAKLEADLLGAVWSDLAGHASKAYLAGWSLSLHSQISVPFLKEKLKVAPAAPAKQVELLIADLDSPQFALREKATKSLLELGDAAEAAIRKALKGQPTVETRRRLEVQLEKRLSDQLRKLRAVEVLERVGTAEARGILESLARDTSNPTVAEAADAAARKLGSR
jgi:WD40 repeat protein